MAGFQPPPTATASTPLPHVDLDPFHILPITQRQRGLSRTDAERAHLNENRLSAATLTPTSSRTSGHTSTSIDSSARRITDHGQVRSLPPWIESFEAGEARDALVANHSVTSPPQTRAAQHHFSTQDPERRISRDGYVEDEPEPSGLSSVPERGLFHLQREPERGRKWDHLRKDDSVFINGDIYREAPWVTKLVRSSMYGPTANEDSQRMDYKFLDQQTPGYFRPWRGDADEETEKGVGLLHSHKQRRIWYKRLQHVLLMHPLVPLILRMIVLSTSLIAVGLALSIYTLTSGSEYPQTPSTIMAIIVDLIAIPYIMYITWDEYTGKPLGLRSPKAKIRLVLLDVFFIIFESANLAIAFSALSDSSGSCRPGSTGVNHYICNRNEALVAFLLIALLAWSLTFGVSIFRLVERVGGREEGD